MRGPKWPSFWPSPSGTPPLLETGGCWCQNLRVLWPPPYQGPHLW
jgi:hypothetical protein